MGMLLWICWFCERYPLELMLDIETCLSSNNTGVVYNWTWSLEVWRLGESSALDTNEGLPRDTIN